MTGNITGTRQHSFFQFTKEIYRSIPYHPRSGDRTDAKHRLIRFYHINDTEQPEEYFRFRLERVNVISVSPTLHDTQGWLVARHPEEATQNYQKNVHRYTNGICSPLMHRMRAHYIVDGLSGTFMILIGIYLVRIGKNKTKIINNRLLY